MNVVRKDGMFTFERCCPGTAGASVHHETATSSDGHAFSGRQRRMGVQLLLSIWCTHLGPSDPVHSGFAHIGMPGWERKRDEVQGLDMKKSLFSETEGVGISIDQTEKRGAWIHFRIF